MRAGCGAMTENRDNQILVVERGPDGLPPPRRHRRSVARVAQGLAPAGRVLGALRGRTAAAPAVGVRKPNKTPSPESFRSEAGLATLSASLWRACDGPDANR